MVTGDPLAPTPSDPGDRPGAISGFALILPLPQPGNCQGPKYRGPASGQAGPEPASGLGKEKSWSPGASSEQRPLGRAQVPTLSLHTVCSCLWVSAHLRAPDFNYPNLTVRSRFIH